MTKTPHETLQGFLNQLSDTVKLEVEKLESSIESIKKQITELDKIDSETRTARVKAALRIENTNGKVEAYKDVIRYLNNVEVSVDRHGELIMLYTPEETELENDNS